MKAAIYSRFSTDRQTESSIADQVRVCTEFAKAQGWRITERFEDQGISGAALGNRPGVLAMRDAAKAGRFNVLIVMDISRLSRSMGDVAKLTEQLVFAGTRVVAVHDNADTAREGWEMQFGLAGLIGQHFRKMVSMKTRTALELRAKSQRPTGGKAYGYANGSIDRDQAKIVAEIFGRFAAGASCRAIAEDLNRRGVPSPGSSWDRTVRRARGWAGSGIRAILLNEKYRGLVVWGASVWKKDPDSGMRRRIEKPRSEWITHTDESLRIVSDELFALVQRRFRPDDSASNRTGGKARFLLSGLLRCDTCGAHYVMVSGVEYGCSARHDGRACQNSVRVKRKHAESVLLDGLRRDLLSDESIKVIGQDMLAYYRAQESAAKSRAEEAPREVLELEARLTRLRDRLKNGDPDLTADELQAAVDRADAKLAELRRQVTAKGPSAKILTLLPKAAEKARAEIDAAMAGDSRASLKARLFLKEAFGGKVRLVAEPEGGLVAQWNLAPGALLRLVGTSGSGGRI